MSSNIICLSLRWTDKNERECFAMQLEHKISTLLLFYSIPTERKTKKKKKKNLFYVDFNVQFIIKTATTATCKEIEAIFRGIF